MATWFKIDKEGAKKIGKSFILTVLAAGFAALGEWAKVIDFGGYQNIAIVVIPFILNTLKVWILPNQNA